MRSIITVPGAWPQTMLTVLTQKPLFSKGKPADAHHPRHVQPRALGRKAGDEFAVLLCRSHHSVSTRSKPPADSGGHTRVNRGRIQLERTIRAIDSEILSTMDETTPE